MNGAGPLWVVGWLVAAVAVPAAAVAAITACRRWAGRRQGRAAARSPPRHGRDMAGIPRRRGVVPGHHLRRGAAVTRYLRFARRRPSVPRSAYRLLATLRPDTTRPVEPLDPCGNPPDPGARAARDHAGRRHHHPHRHRGQVPAVTAPLDPAAGAELPAPRTARPAPPPRRCGNTGRPRSSPATGPATPRPLRRRLPSPRAGGPRPRTPERTTLRRSGRGGHAAGRGASVPPGRPGMARAAEDRPVRPRNAAKRRGRFTRAPKRTGPGMIRRPPPEPPDGAA